MIKTAIALLCILWSWTAGAAETTAAPAVIVHNSVAIDKLSSAQLRSIYMMRQVLWPDGSPIKVYVLPSASPIHRQFSRQQLQLFPYQLERVWQKLTYSGTGTPPEQLATSIEMLAMVASTPGAIGYTEIYEANDAIKKLAITP